MKQMEVREKRIGENSFYIRPFPAFKAANISGNLFAILTPILGSLLPLLGGTANTTDIESVNVMDMDIEKAMPTLSTAFSSISGDKFETMMKQLLTDSENISVEGPATEGQLTVLSYNLANEVFCGEVQDMYVLCFEVIKINFGGFFKKLGAQFGNPQDLLQKLAPGLANTENLTAADSQTSN